MTHDLGDLFDSTRWTLVAAAGDPDPSVARKAREELCQQYWRPIFVSNLGFGDSRDDALDVTQGFFALIIERKDFEHACPERGSLSAFLKTSLRHYRLNDGVHQRAQKRGNGQILLSLDALELARLEADVAHIPVDRRTPERLFDRQAARDVLDGVRARLRAEWTAAGKAGIFELLQGCLDDRLPRGAYAPLAVQLDCTANALRIEAHRIRKRFREELDATIADTLPPDGRDEAAITHGRACLKQALRMEP